MGVKSTDCIKSSVKEKTAASGKNSRKVLEQQFREFQHVLQFYYQSARFAQITAELLVFVIFLILMCFLEKNTI